MQHGCQFGVISATSYRRIEYDFITDFLPYKLIFLRFVFEVCRGKQRLYRNAPFFGSIVFTELNKLSFYNIFFAGFFYGLLYTETIAESLFLFSNHIIIDIDTVIIDFVFVGKGQGDFRSQCDIERKFKIFLFVKIYFGL